ncbi:hypothetical protein AWI08_19180 [Klebsiella aerogenes]|nr:hypothetical protein AWI08_19180 [Klebsiella aerogenes]
MAAIIAKHHIARLYWPSNHKMMPVAAKETDESPPSNPSMPSTILKALIAAQTAKSVRKKPKGPRTNSHEPKI